MEKSFEKIDVIKIAVKLSSLNIIILLIGLLKNKISAIFLGSESFGFLGLTLSVIGFSYIFASFGSNREMVYRISNGDNYYTSLILFPQIVLSLIFGIIIGILVWVNQISVFNFLHILLIPILIVTNTINLTYFQYLRGLREIQRFSRFQLILNLLFILSYYLFFKNLGDKGILPSLLVVNICFFSFIIFNDKRFRKSFSFKKVLKFKEIRFTLPYLLNDIINLFPFLLVQLIIKDDPKLLSFTVLLLAILNQYFGAFFKGINTDFYPRLTQTFKKSHKGAIELINYQAGLNLIIVSIATLFINSFTKLFTILISSDKFSGIENSISMICIIVLIRAISNSFGQCFPSKGDKYSVNTNDILFTITFLTSFIFLRKTIENIAIGLLIASLFHLTSTLFLAYKKHGVLVSSKILTFYIINIISAFIIYLSKKFDAHLLMMFSILIFSASTLLLVIQFYKISKNGHNLLSK